MIRPFAIGALASVVASAPVLVQSALRNAWPEGSSAAAAPANVLFVALIAALIQRYGIERRPGAGDYEGLPDMLMHVHSPSSPDSASRWSFRGFISLLLATFAGGAAGPEGAATELSHSALIRVRSRSARWFEQRRRTDAACALAAGVSAGFGAPFAAVLLTIELGFGGRIISAAVASLAALLATRQLSSAFPEIRSFDLGGGLYGFGLLDFKEWLGVLLIGVAGGAAGALLTGFVRYCRRNFVALSGRHASARIFAGGLLLFAIGSIWLPGFAPAQQVLEEVLWSRRAPTEVGLLILSSALTLATLIGCFGTVGIFWPLFALGGYFGFSANYWAFGDLPGFAAAAGLIGGAALWGSVLGAPVAGAVLVLEISRNHQMLLPALAAALAAKYVAKLFRSNTLLDRELRDRGLRLMDGRSAEILETLNAGNAMVTDFETLREQESVSELHTKLVSSPYPFFPVVRTDGKYSGLLTLDMVQDAWHTDATVTSHSSLSKLLEVKDLLYRNGARTPCIRAEQSLAEVSKLFERHPCLPVVHEGLVIGLLFAHGVRMAYDREVARRSLLGNLPGPV